MNLESGPEQVTKTTIRLSKELHHKYVKKNTSYNQHSVSGLQLHKRQVSSHEVEISLADTHTSARKRRVRHSNSFIQLKFISREVLLFKNIVCCLYKVLGIILLITTDILDIGAFS